MLYLVLFPTLMLFPTLIPWPWDQSKVFESINHFKYSITLLHDSNISCRTEFSIMWFILALHPKGLVIEDQRGPCEKCCAWKISSSIGHGRVSLVEKGLQGRENTPRQMKVEGRSAYASVCWTARFAELFNCTFYPWDLLEYFLYKSSNICAFLLTELGVLWI